MASKFGPLSYYYPIFFLLGHMKSALAELKESNPNICPGGSSEIRGNPADSKTHTLADGLKRTERLERERRC